MRIRRTEVYTPVQAVPCPTCERTPVEPGEVTEFDTWDGNDLAGLLSWIDTRRVTIERHDGTVATYEDVTPPLDPWEEGA